MAAQGRTRKAEPSGQQRRAVIGDRGYDSFVIRVWTDLGTREWLRAEVEHVQTGSIAQSERVHPGWITDRLKDHIADELAEAETASGAVAKRAEEALG